jgi:hypothetical protein
MNLILAAAPLDLTATGTEIAGWIGAAAAAGTVIFVALYGVWCIVHAFSIVADDDGMKRRGNAPERDDDAGDSTGGNIRYDRDNF